MTLVFSWDRQVLRVTLDAPATRNALSSQLLAELTDVVSRVASDDLPARAVVITGAEPAFCAGLDLRERTSGRTASGRPLVDLVHAIRSLPVPVVARVNGAARAGGLVLLAACDIAVAASAATFAMTETRLGLTPEMTLATISAQVSSTLLRRLALTGEVFDAHTAERLHLVSEVAPPGALDETVDRVLDALRQCAPQALAATKTRLADRSGHPDLDTLHRAADASASGFTTPEAQEGLTALRERRPPTWAR